MSKPLRQQLKVLSFVRNKKDATVLLSHKRNDESLPCLVVSDEHGNVFEIPELLMAAASAGCWILPKPDALIPLPDSGVFFTMVKRHPVGYDPVAQEYVVISEYDGEPVYAVAAFMPPGYLQTLSCAYDELPDAPRLPLFCYSAAGWKNGKFYAAGYRIDKQLRQDIPDAMLPEVDRKAQILLKNHPENRLVSHLVTHCVLQYRCPNACNLALGRWECPVPISKVCNAACIGCISLQPKSSCIPSTQHRIAFTPTVEEITGYVVPHLVSAPMPIASFGQGCEGEPLLEADLIEASIHAIRAQTERGIININTNGSLPDAVERLCKAGLNSMRVSLNSAQHDYYHAYYRPKNYTFDDVIASIGIAGRHGVWVSLNYLMFPGFTDHPSEIKALSALLETGYVSMIQTRNLNIDPAWYMDSLMLNDCGEQALGIKSWVGEMRKRFPDVELGYFNPTYSQVQKKRT
jgi:molybdenum cofactor biosynthesis enzyme MoaA